MQISCPSRQFTWNISSLSTKKKKEENSQAIFSLPLPPPQPPPPPHHYSDWLIVALGVDTFPATRPPLSACAPKTAFSRGTSPETINTLYTWTPYSKYPKISYTKVVDKMAKRNMQTVQTQIRLLLQGQSDQWLHCLPFQYSKTQT